MDWPESDFHGQMAGSWEALGEGAPTLAALAGVCARAVVHPPAPVALEELSGEAQAILFAAGERGVIEVRGVSTAFEAPARMLAIYVEEDPQRTIAFRDRERPEVTLRFFEGFCELCRGGLVLHHLHRDFSLTKRGFELARRVEREKVAELLELATEFGLHD
ncbi:hypothetical protein [Candidatus Laterigemmans baculatus]|uniref:hypothetical protein n=1 Tax=Candidatus Laterigemmans baculatus TaxID=2770505 RepID=UPI0013DA01CC|nr:hypothetical protein [Candidatus Laterigemmans baculatus]